MKWRFQLKIATEEEHLLYFLFFPENVYDKQHTIMTSVIAGSFESEYFLVSLLNLEMSDPGDIQTQAVGPGDQRGGAASFPSCQVAP